MNGMSLLCTGDLGSALWLVCRWPGNIIFHCRKMASLMTPETFASTRFDYLIAGGGTAGLVVANRLTEIPTVSVGVIEAGEDLTDDFKITTPLYMFQLQGDPRYDWNFTSEPQVCETSLYKDTHQRIGRKH